MITRARFEASAAKKSIVQDELLLHSSQVRSQEGGVWEVEEHFIDTKEGGVWGYVIITKKREGEALPTEADPDLRRS